MRTPLGWPGPDHRATTEPARYDPDLPADDDHDTPRPAPRHRQVTARRTLATWAVALILLGACSPPTQHESDVRNATNYYRLTLGVPLEGLSYNLQDRARAWASRLAYTQLLEHSNLYLLLDAYGLRGCAENLYRGPSLASGVEVVRAWQHSPRHDEALRDPVYAMTGVGVAYDGDGEQWVDAMYCW